MNNALLVITIIWLLFNDIGGMVIVAKLNKLTGPAVVGNFIRLCLSIATIIVFWE